MKKSMYEIYTINGIEEVTGIAVTIPNYERLETFAHKHNDEWIVSEVRTGRRFPVSESTIEKCVNKIANTLIWQQTFNDNYPSVYETINGAIERYPDTLLKEPYAQTEPYKPTRNEKIKVLEDKIKEEQEAMQEKQRQARLTLSYIDTSFLRGFISRIEQRIEQIKLEQ